MPIQPENGSPVMAGKVPTVTLGGVAYRLRFSALAEFIADDAGVNINSFIVGIRERNAGNLSTFLKLFAAMVAHQFIALKQPVPDALHWAAVISDEPDEGAKTSEICKAVADVLVERLGKQKASVVKLREPAPEQPDRNVQ